MISFIHVILRLLPMNIFPTKTELITLIWKMSFHVKEKKKECLINMRQSQGTLFIRAKLLMATLK